MLSPMMRLVTLQTTKSVKASAAAVSTGSLVLSLRSFLYLRDKNTRHSKKEANTSAKSKTGATFVPIGAAPKIGDYGNM